MTRTTIGETRDEAGQLAIVQVGADRYGVVLLCLRSEYVRGDEESEGDRESGWYSEWREPSADEMASPEYARLVSMIAAARDEDERAQQAIHARRRQENEERRRFLAEHPEIARYEAEQEAKLAAEHPDVPAIDQGLLDALYGDD